MNRMSWLIGVSLIALVGLYWLSSNNKKNNDVPALTPLESSIVETAPVEEQVSEVEAVVSKVKTGDDYIRDGLEAAANVKALIEAHYLSEKNWPNSNGQLDVKPADQTGIDGVNKLEVLQDGWVMLTFGAASGIDGGQVLFKPAFDANAQRLNWKCFSAEFKQISTVAPECKYTGV